MPQQHWSETFLTICNVFSKRSCLYPQTATLITKNNDIISMNHNGSEDPSDTTHSEVNAILSAAKCGRALEGCVMYTTLAPCLQCARHIKHVGITKVYYTKFINDRDGLAFLSTCHIETIHLGEKERVGTTYGRFIVFDE